MKEMTAVSTASLCEMHGCLAASYVSITNLAREQIACLEAENERLREALREITKLSYHSLDPDVDQRMTKIAEAALSK